MFAPTEAFNILSQSWNDFTEHWKFTALCSFLVSVLAYLGGTENKELLIILMFMVLVDTVLGTTVALSEKRFNAKGMGKTIMKVILYGCFLIMFHLAEILLDGTTGLSTGDTLMHNNVIDLIAYFYLIIREAKSANEKLATFSIGLPFNPFLLLENLMNKYSAALESQQQPVPVPLTIDEKLTVAKTKATNIESGVKTADEYRAEAGLEPTTKK